MASDGLSVADWEGGQLVAGAIATHGLRCAHYERGSIITFVRLQVQQGLHSGRPLCVDIVVVMLAT